MEDIGILGDLHRFTNSYPNKSPSDTMQNPRFRHPHHLPTSDLRKAKELGGKLMPHPRHDVCSGAGIQVTQNVLDDLLVSNDDAGNWDFLSLFNGKIMGNAWENIGTYGKM